MNIQEKLWELRDSGYAQFQAKLTPTVAPELFIGVRVPQLRLLAKEIYKSTSYEEFLNRLPHRYYDENILHALIVSEIKDMADCLQQLSRFLPYVDNWAVCDILSPKVFKKNRSELLAHIKVWISSDHSFTSRFGMEMLMSHFLDTDFKPEYLEYPASVSSEEYYVRMMIAWFYATALAKQWDAALPYLKENRLDVWTHNKTIQKARESFRITDEQKELLKSLKRQTS